VPIQKWLFSPISLLSGNFNPRNINHMPAVKISARLKLDENISFLDGHQLAAFVPEHSNGWFAMDSYHLSF
jgi:hypothetical protein